MPRSKEYASFSGGPVDGKTFPFVGKAEPVKKLRLWLAPYHQKVWYKRTTRRGNVHYYKFQYTHTQLFP